MKKITFGLALFLFFSSSALAYLEPSFRLKALGEDFVGIIVDEYTDIFRNPAYLSLVENYKILGEYRKDGSNRLVAGGVLPKFGFGKIAILGKGWQQDSKNIYSSRNVYPYGNYIQSYESNSENISNIPLTNSGLIYSANLGQNMNLGANFIYFEDKWKSDNQGTSTYSTTDTTSGLLRQKTISEYENHSLKTNKYIQIVAGVEFLFPPALNLDLILSFQHLDLENITSSNSFSQGEYYDSLGNLSQSYKYLNISEYAAPDQEGNRFGMGLRISKELLPLDRINFLLRFSYTDWDKKTKSVLDLFRNDTLKSSTNQIFNGNIKNIDIHLKFGLESKNIGKVKLYAGIANFLSWEKQTYPDSLPDKPTSKFRTSFYKISLPLAIEYHPFKNITLRYGTLPNYVYTRTERIDPNTNSNLGISSNKTIALNNSIGSGFQVTKNLNIEGYILQFGNLLTVDNWMVGASYSF